jgi:hypothetical protein
LASPFLMVGGEGHKERKRGYRGRIWRNKEKKAKKKEEKANNMVTTACNGGGARKKIN